MRGADQFERFADGKRSPSLQGLDTATTLLNDYRRVNGLSVPFHVVTDYTDHAGRTDPRLRTEMTVTAVSTNVTVADAHFAPPEMDATARIEAADGTTRISFDLVNNHIYIDGLINGKQARLLVDTGGTNLLTP